MTDLKYPEDLTWYQMTGLKNPKDLTCYQMTDLKYPEDLTLVNVQHCLLLCLGTKPVHGIVEPTSEHNI